MFYLLITAFYLLFTYLVWKNVRWGVFMVVALLPTYLIRYTIFDIPTTLLEGMIGLLFIIWLIKLKKEKGLTFNPFIWLINIKSKSPVTSHQSLNPIPRFFRWPIVLFLLAATISIFASSDLRAAAGLWKAFFIEPLLFLIVLVHTIKTPADLKKVIRFLGLTVIAIGIFALIQEFTGWLIPNPFWANIATRRVTTFFGFPNANALFLAPLVLLTFGNLLTDRQNVKFQSFNLLVLVFSLLTIFWTKSTGALIGLVIGFICLLIFYNKTRLVTLCLITLTLLFSLIASPLPRYIREAYILAGEVHLPSQATDIQIRVQQWRETWALLKDAPLLGSGLAGYKTAVVPYHQNRHLEIFPQPHNFFLNFWVETGLLGLISISWIIFGFFILIFKILKKRESQINDYVLILTTASAMIVLLIHGLVDIPYFKNDLAVLFWLIVGLMIILFNKSRTFPREGAG